MRIEETVDLAAPAERVWQVCGDPCKLGALSDLINVEPLEGDADRPEIGSRYRVLLKVGAVPVGGNVEIVALEPARELAWTTLTGVDHRMRVRLRERPDGTTRLTVRFAYDTPGFLGTAIDLVAFRAVRRAIRAMTDEAARSVG